jgi:hypothetical protein
MKPPQGVSVNAKRLYGFCTLLGPGARQSLDVHFNHTITPSHPTTDFSYIYRFLLICFPTLRQFSQPRARRWPSLLRTASGFLKM